MHKGMHNGMQKGMHKGRIRYGHMHRPGSWARLRDRQRHEHMHRGLRLRHRLRLWELGMTGALGARSVQPRVWMRE